MAVSARAGATGEVGLAKFRGDARCAVSFTFDDGTCDQLDLAVPILNQFAIKATFYVVPNAVSEQSVACSATNRHGARSGNLSWEELRKMADSGHEIGNHSLTHAQLWTLTNDAPAEAYSRTAYSLEAQVNGAAQMIQQKLGQPPLTFAYPYLGHNERIRAVVRQRHIADRVSADGYGARNAKDFTAALANGKVARAMKEGRWLVPMLHNIEEGWSPVTAATLKEHLAFFASQGDAVWTDTFLAVSRYVKLRESATLTVLPYPLTADERRLKRPERQEAGVFVTDKGAKILTFLLTSPLDPKLFTEPLTVVIPTEGGPPSEVRAEWAVDGGRTAPAVPALVRGGKILVDVVPGPTAVQVRWK